MFNFNNILIYILLSFILTSCSADNQDKNNTPYLDRAETYYRSGQLRSALTEINQSPHKQETRRYLLLSQIYNDIGSYHIVVKMGDELIRRIPDAIDDQGFWQAYLNSKLVLQAYDEVFTLQKKYGKNSAIWLNAQARAMIGKNKIPAAIKLLEQSKNANARSLVILAKSYHLLNQLEQRDRYVKEAKIKDKKSYYLWLFIAEVAWNNKDYNLSQEAYSKALAVFKNHNMMTREKMVAQIGLIDTFKAQEKFELAHELSKEINEIQKKHYTRSYDSANELFKEGNYLAAEKALKPLMQQFKGQGMPMLLMSLIENQKGNKEAAQAYLDTLEKQASGEPKHRVLLAQANLSIGNTQKAAEILAEIDIKHAPDEAAGIRYLQGIMALDKKNYSQGKIHLEVAITLDKSNVKYQRALAITEKMLGHQDVAESILLTSIQQHSDNLKGILLYFRIMEDKSKAEEQIKKLYAANPGQFAAPLAISLLMRQKNNQEQAILWINKAQIADNNNQDIKKIKADLLSRTAREAEKNEDWATAQQWIQESIRLEPSSIKYHYISAFYYAKQKDIESAIVQIDAISTLDPQKNANVAAIMAANIHGINKDYPMSLKVLQQRWEKEESIQILQALIRLRKQHFPNTSLTTEAETWHKKQSNTQSSLLLAIAYQTANDDSKAISQFKDVLKRDKKNPIALNNLAWLILKETPPQALIYAQQAHQLQPENPDITDTYGWALYKNQQNTEALEVLKKAYKQSKQNPTIAGHLAEVYRITGDNIIADAIERKHGIKTGKTETL
ncbi:MAG: tetratricopeptide repeat protein [Pseudomonadales bacterium]|nr:tetratricopeptide repeat protein [Pseudomonadales bacterium]